MKISLIILAIIFIYFAFATIFHSTQLAGNLGNIIGSANLELFGYLAYINIFLLFYPLYKLHKKPKLAKELDFYAGWLLLLVSMIILPALIFDNRGSGILSQQISEFLLPYIGQAGMWLFWLMTVLLALVLILEDDFSFELLLEDIKELFAGPIEYFSNISWSTITWKSIKNLISKIFTNPFGPSYEDMMMPAQHEIEEVNSVNKAPKSKNSPKNKVDLLEENIKKNIDITELKEASVEKKVLDDEGEQGDNRIQKLSTNSHVEIVNELEENSKLLNEIEKGIVEKPKNFKLPKLDFLQKVTKQSRKINEAEIDKKIGELLDKLGRFKIEGDVVRTYSGPLVTTFEFKPAPNVKVSKVLGLQDDLAMALSAETIRIQAPIPGRNVIGIEIPNESFDTIYLREILES